MQSGREVDKFDGFNSVERSENGLYYLTKYANAYLSAKVTEQFDLGSHMLFIGEVTAGEVLSDGVSCTYGYYQSDIKPKAKKTEKKQWICTVCGYVYEGEEVPDDFICPLCNHGKEDFVLQTDGEKSDEKKNEAAPTKYVCTVCGYVHEGNEPPEICPICKVGPDKFVKE